MTRTNETSELLFTNGKLNRKEAFNRLEYWIDRPSYAHSVIRLLVGKLREDEINVNPEMFRRYRLALEGLTPGGSEYSGDPERCADTVRKSLHSRMDLLKDKVKRIHELEAKVESLLSEIAFPRSGDRYGS